MGERADLVPSTRVGDIARCEPPGPPRRPAARACLWPLGRSVAPPPHVAGARRQWLCYQDPRPSRGAAGGECTPRSGTGGSACTGTECASSGRSPAGRLRLQRQRLRADCASALGWHLCPPSSERVELGRRSAMSVIAIAKQLMPNCFSNLCNCWPFGTPSILMMIDLGGLPGRSATPSGGSCSVRLS